MPRQSAEARSARAHQVGSKPPPVPAGFRDVEAQLWREIVRSKPIGWFDAGSLPLLGQYCQTMAAAQRIAASLAEMAVDDDWAAGLEKRLVKLNSSCTTLATKLRLSVQATVDRRNKILDEDGAGEAADNSLLGGKAVWPVNLRMAS